MELFVLRSEGSLTRQIVLELLNPLSLRLDDELLLLGAVFVLGLVKDPLIEFLAKLLVFLFKHVAVLLEDLDFVLEALQLAHLFKELIDLILLQLNRFVSGKYLNLDVFELCKQLDDLLILVLQFESQLIRLVQELVNLLLRLFGELTLGGRYLGLLFELDIEVGLATCIRFLLLQAFAHPGIAGFHLLGQPTGVGRHLLTHSLVILDDLDAD